jgi:hypothetical protein
MPRFGFRVVNSLVILALQQLTQRRSIFQHSETYRPTSARILSSCTQWLFHQFLLRITRRLSSGGFNASSLPPTTLSDDMLVAVVEYFMRPISSTTYVDHPHPHRWPTLF